MQVTLDLPDDISAALEGRWPDLPRQALEALRVVAVTVDELATVPDELDRGERAAIALAEKCFAPQPKLA